MHSDYDFFDVCILQTGFNRQSPKNRNEKNYCFHKKDTTSEIYLIIITTMASTSADAKQTQAWMKQETMILDGRYGHGSAKIDEHRMIIVGGIDEDGNTLSSGYIYDVRTQQSTRLLNDMPVTLYRCYVVANKEFVYVIGGRDDSRDSVNTVYRLCLKTFKWTTMAPMGTARNGCAAAVRDEYIYVFGGLDDALSSAERYSIDNNTWEVLQDMPKGPCFGPCAISTTGSEIYIVGNEYCSVDVFDTASLSWKNPTYLRDMPEVRHFAAAVLVKKKYLVVIGGSDMAFRVTAGCLIYDIWCNRWSSTPASMDMNKAFSRHTAAVLDGKIVVAGGLDRDDNTLASVECIDADALLEYAPLQQLQHFQKKYCWPTWFPQAIQTNCMRRSAFRFFLS